MNELVNRTLHHIENEQIQQAKKCMVTLYDYIQEHPHELNNIDNPDNFASVIATMLQLKVPNDDDAIEQIAGIGYVVISKSIYSQPAPNKNMFRLLMIHFAREHFNFIFRPAFDLLKGGSVWSTRALMIGTEISNAIYKMEIADLYRNPIIYQKIQMFADAKSELDALIANSHFYNQTLEEIIDEGISLHKKAFEYLKEKYLNEIDNDSNENDMDKIKFDTYTPHQFLKPFAFDFQVARFEEWQNGIMISSGIPSMYTGIVFNVYDSEYGTSVGIISLEPEFEKLIDFSITYFEKLFTLHDRKILVSIPPPSSRDTIGIVALRDTSGITRPSEVFEDKEPYCCSLFTVGGEVEKITFSFNNPERLIEFYKLDNT